MASRTPQVLVHATLDFDDRSLDRRNRRAKKHACTPLKHDRAGRSDLESIGNLVGRPKIADGLNYERRCASIEALDGPLQIGSSNQKSVTQASNGQPAACQQCAMNRHRLRAVLEAADDRKHACFCEWMIGCAMRVTLANNCLFVIRHDAVNQAHATGVRQQLLDRRHQHADDVTNNTRPLP